MMKKLVIFGATGSCGVGVLQRAVELGTFGEVVAVVRSERKAKQLFGDKTLENVKLVQAGVDNAPEISTVLKDADYVCSAVASFASPHTQMSTLTSHVIAAAKERANDKPKLRYICYGLCGLRHESLTWMQHMVGFMSPFKFGPALKDHQRQMSMLEENRTALEYSVFGTCTMVNLPMGRPFKGGTPEELHDKARLYNRIGILDAADLVLERLQDDTKEPPPILDIVYE